MHSPSLTGFLSESDSKIPNINFDPDPDSVSDHGDHALPILNRRFAG